MTVLLTQIMKEHADAAMADRKRARDDDSNYGSNHEPPTNLKNKAYYTTDGRTNKHKRRVQPQLPVNDQGYVLCSNCGGDDHMPNRCPQRPGCGICGRPHAGRCNQRCPFCGKIGHRPSDCMKHLSELKMAMEVRNQQMDQDRQDRMRNERQFQELAPRIQQGLVLPQRRFNGAPFQSNGQQPRFNGPQPRFNGPQRRFNGPPRFNQYRNNINNAPSWLN